MKISNLCSIVAFVGLCLVSAGGKAQSDTEVLVPLARGVVAAPAQSGASTYEGQVIEDLPAVVAHRLPAKASPLATHKTMPTSYLLGLLGLCAVTGSGLTLRRLMRASSLPSNASPGRISLV